MEWICFFYCHKVSTLFSYFFFLVSCFFRPFSVLLWFLIETRLRKRQFNPHFLSFRITIWVLLIPHIHSKLRCRCAGLRIIIGIVKEPKGNGTTRRLRIGTRGRNSDIKRWFYFSMKYKKGTKKNSVVSWFLSNVVFHPLNFYSHFFLFGLRSVGRLVVIFARVMVWTYI